MDGRKLRGILKYAALQVVDLALLVLALLYLRRWYHLSRWLMGVLIAAWIVKDILLYPLVRRAYESGAPEDAHPMIGARGVAKQRIDPSGYAWVRGELWLAEVLESGRCIEEGKPLRVRDARGVTLLVVPDEDGED